jgi:Isocitrate lyase family
VNEVGPDLGDYAYTTVPNQVHRMFKAQQLHDKKQYHARRQMSAEERAKTPYVDYMRPIVADADTGHGGLGTVMKLAKLFAESVLPLSVRFLTLGCCRNSYGRSIAWRKKGNLRNYIPDYSVDIWLAKSSCHFKTILTGSSQLVFNGI